MLVVYMMLLMLLLLACFGFTRAQVPDTCPRPPQNLLCLLGPRNTCTNDSDCEPGTLCCYDGCRRRCRDPSTFSMAAREAKPRPGACRVLSPPSEFCPSDFDECQFDWDCTDSTKKCCSNNCYRICAEPGVVAVQDSCPAPNKLLRCHFGLGNQCVNHSECSYLKNGLCCFDGCRRICATPAGFEARLQTERPGKCPVLPYPEFCVADADECEFDGDCFPGKKCCSNDCFNRCVDPLDPLKGGDLGKIGQISGATAGKCPVPSTTHRCHIGLTHTCNKDEECPANLYCCFDGCRRTCFDPEKNSSSAVQGEKGGTCPGLPAPELCASDVDECFLDSDCFGDRKCCSNGCYKLCVSPSESAVGAAVKCPQPAVHHCSHSLEHLCDDTDECTSGMVCCFDGCRRRCVPPRGTPDTCPKEPQNLLCFVGLRNTCVDDNSCKTGTLCCRDGCRKRCRDPSNFNRGATEGKPRPGVCPILSPPSEFCPSDFDECQFDWDCEGSTKKCCSNTCYKVCAEPGVGADQDPCPVPRDLSKCHMGLRNLCLNNSQCGHVENGICCFDGCRRRCATPKGFEATLQTERPGRCPLLLEPEFCVSHADECEFDGDCYPGKKCCSNNCFKSCVDPELGLIGSTSDRRCPIPSNTTRCHIGLVHTCNTDKECPTKTYCCFDGCRRKCLDPDDRNKARPGGEQKNGLCPALPAPEFCASDMDECFIDWDCVDDRKCCSNDCFKVCVSPGEGGVAAAVKCPEPVVHHCSRSLKHLCDNSDDCSGKTVCCFDGCRRRCIDSKGEIGVQEGITVSCRKSEMQIDVERGVLNGFKSVFLRLNDRSCLAQGNETHFTLIAPLMSCGTFSKHTEDSVVYSNEVQEEEFGFEGVITRMPELSIPFSCFYTKEGVTSTFGLIPSKVRMTMDGGDTTTEFVLEMAVFRDQQFQIPYGARDFPLKVFLSKPLYIQLSVDSPDTRLTIKEQRCYATPTQNPKDKMQYDIIRDGCIVDSTVTYYPAPTGVRRFSFETFQFTGQNGNFVYLHCDLLVCNVSNALSRCSIGCLSYPRKRRDLKEPGVAKAALTEGPFLLGGKHEAKSRSTEGSSINVNTWVVTAMAVFCALCLGIIVYMKVKTSSTPKPDPDRETYI